MSEGLPDSAQGWLLLYHPLLLAELEALTKRVEALKQRDGVAYVTRNDTKRLAAIFRLITEIMSANLADPQFRQGNTLGASHRGWFRAKFFQQYRLFFRFDARSRTIIYAWVNDEETKRAYDSKTDAYAVFAKMLATGNPPSDWDDLIREAQRPSA
jgi:toxin YhaV